MIGDKKYTLKRNVDRAWSSISLRLKPSPGSKYGSTKSLNRICEPDKLSLPPPYELQRSLSSGATSSECEEELSIDRKPKPQFVVLVSRSDSTEIDWDDGKDFILEQVYSTVYMLILLHY